MNDKITLRALIVEDSEDDAQLLLRELRHSGYAPVSERVDSAEAMRTALSRHRWDLILSDYVIPGFGGLEALAIAQASGLDLPFILISNKVSEETLVTAMRAGAGDFLMKDRLERLGPVVKRELADATARRGLRQARLEWRTVIDAVDDAILVHDTEFRVVRANLTYAALAGLPVTQVIGKPYWEIFPKRDGPLPGCRNVMENGGMAEENVELADGRAFISRSFAVSRIPGQSALFVHVMQDVTERTRVQEAIASNERRFRALLQHASDLVVVTAADGTITYVSPSVTQLAGYEIDEALGKNFISFVHPDDVLAAAAAYAAIIRDPSMLHTSTFRFRNKGGTWTTLETVAKNALADPLIAGVVMNARDVTERNRAQQALAESEQRYRTLFDSGNDTIVIVGLDGRILEANRIAGKRLGRSREELLQMTVAQIDAPVYAAKVHERMEMLRSRGSAVFESAHQRADGGVIPVEISSQMIEYRGAPAILSIARDITERKQAEAVRVELAAIVASSQDAIYGTDLDGVVTSWNQGAERLFGYGAHEMIGQPVALLACGAEADETAALRQRALCGEMVSDVEAVRWHKNGNAVEVAFTVSVIRDAEGRATGISVVARDIAERKRAQRQVEESEAKLRGIFEAVVDGIAVTDPQTRRLISSNGAFHKMLGYRPDEIPALQVSDIHPPESLADVLAMFERQCRGELKTAADLPVRRKDGSVFFADITTAPAVIVDKPQLVGVFHDVTERKQAEEQLKRLNWALRALGQSNSALVHAETEKDLFQSCCDAIAGAEGYPLAWVGLVRDDAAGSIEVAAAAGRAIRFLEGFAAASDNSPLGRGPTGTAIRTGVAQVIDNLGESAAYLPWIESARANGLASVISLPLRIDSAGMGALVVYGVVPGAFGQAEVALFEELAADIGYGIASRRTRIAYEASLAQRELATHKLRAAFESLIAVLAATVEQRDPYTAGHQRRVAELSAAIGAALGLDPACIEGLHFAATIHDIGKIYVPAEILSRPGKLSPTEFELIKSHVQVGYDIVKDVEFPWEVATVIQQHHERLDGSGYPRGLKGDQIRIEARILAVADMVEAMSSHRPYRAGLGLDRALAQMKKEAGITLDAQVVDACERVFREQGFAFSKL